MASNETNSDVNNETVTSGGSTKKSVILRIANLILRVFTLVLLIIALIVLAINSKTLDLITGEEVELRFQDIYAYRYMLSAIVIGTAYTLLQLAFSIYHIINNAKDNVYLLFDFYGDKIISYLLATGAAAGFGLTKDMNEAIDISELEDFYAKGYASASLLLLAFVCTAVLSVLSSYALPK
ncbi:hypothetical protein UlMin_025665 [Ulmus minor]